MTAAEELAALRERLRAYVVELRGRLEWDATPLAPKHPDKIADEIERRFLQEKP